MTIQRYSTLIECVQWDGTNAAEVADYVQAYTVANPTQFFGTYDGFSVTGGVLTIKFTQPLNNYDLLISDWIVRDRLTLQPMLNADMIRQYHSVVSVFQEMTKFAVGVGTVPSITAGATSTPFSVQIQPMMPSTSYSAVGQIIGSIALQGQLQVESVTVVDESHVNVIVKNIAGVTVSGGRVLITAITL